MKKIVLFLILLCGICFGQIRPNEEKTDFSPLLRFSVPTTTTIIVYSAFKNNGFMERSEQFNLLLISLGVSIGTSIIYEILDENDFKLRNIGDYSIGMLAGGSFVMLWEF